MGSLEKVATKDITQFKKNIEKEEGISSSELKKKLLDTVETNQLMQMLKTTSGGEKSPLEVLNDVGFNIKDLTGGMKENVELYKGLVELEAKRRSEVEERENVAREQVYGLREKLLETTISQQMEKYNQTVGELVKKLENNKEGNKNDPINNVSNELMLKLLSDKIEELTNPRQYNPIEEIFGAMEMYETLKNKFKPDKTEFPNDPKRIDLEIMKLKMEDERARIIEEKKLKLDSDKHETIKYAINTIGSELADALGAFASALSISRQNNAYQQPQHQAQPEPQQSIQGIPYQCEKCGGVFILQQMVDNAVCPYCGDTGQAKEEEKNLNNDVG